MMEINDVIYGTFSVPLDVAAIILTPQFQRLKSIKQLGFLRIPDGIEQKHHRYAHCLGTYYAAGLALDALEKNTAWLRNNNNKIPLIYRKAVQVAALLHDIAHGPFSHSWERIANNYTHEKEAIYSVNQIFEKLNQKQFLELRQNNNYGIELVKAIIQGDIASFKFKNEMPNKFKFVFEIVNNKRSKLDVDKWDYLKRDAYYLKHLSQPNMDFDDVFLKARISHCGSHIEYRYEDYDKIYNLFAARYDFHINCYSLPEFIISDYILKFAIQETQPKINKFSIIEIEANDVFEFLQLTDNNVLKLVENSVLSKFLQTETVFQKVDRLENLTGCACIKVKSVSKYMPVGERISFYGDVKQQPVLNDQTKCIKKIYTFYCDQSTQTVCYMVS